MVNYKDKDGIMRNALKMLSEGKRVAKTFWFEFTYWLRKPWSSHRYVDIFVETLRTSPYFWGHVLAPVPLAAVAYVVYFYYGSGA